MSAIVNHDVNILNSNRKTAGELIWLLCGFSKKVSYKERVKPWFFVTFNIIIGHIFPENLFKIPDVVQKIWTIYLSILAIFIDFLEFWHFLITKKLMASAYNRWCQYLLHWKNPALLGLKFLIIALLLA